MNKRKLHWIFSRYMSPEGEHSANGGAPADTAADDSGSSDDSAVDWSGLNEGVEPGSDDEETDDSDAAPATPPAKAKPAKEASDPDATPEETPAEDEPDPAEKTSEDSTPEDDTPPKPLTPEEIAAQEQKLQKDFKEWQEGELKRLEGEYALDEETAQRLQTEPELVLPQVAARLHLEVMQKTLEVVQRMIPQMVPQVVNTQNTEKAAMDKFYGVNPDLKKYHKQVLQAGAMFRKLNPKASPDEAALKIGAIVRDSLGLKPLKAGEEKAPPAKPGSKAPPHKPAGAGGGSGTKTAPAKTADTTWTDLIDDD